MSNSAPDLLRVIVVSVFARALALVSDIVAQLLTRSIGFVTNLAFYARLVQLQLALGASARRFEA